MTTLWFLSFLILTAAAALTMIRMIKGPNAVDRVLCLDLLTLIVAALIGVHGAWIGLAVFLDAIVVLTVIAFTGTIVFARFIEGGRHKKRNLP